MAKSEYRLIDSGNFRKLEQLGQYRIVRPSLQAIWEPKLSKGEWQKADAVFTRGKGGDGEWKLSNKRLPSSWPIKVGPVTTNIKLTDFGHVGIFPEHHKWDRLSFQIKKSKQKNEEFKLLSLFAYTGITSVAAASLGAHVVHVDASKTSVAWGRENAQLSGLEGLPIRWLVDDVQKFLAREIRRGSKYHGVILDPPSFGRGPKGDVWKIEDHLIPLLKSVKEILADDYSFVQLSAHSQGMTPIALSNVLKDVLAPESGKISSKEMTVSEDRNNGRHLPSGACAIFEKWIKPS
jgi:23S rRNA (cytosine1962-C5)-methyltransferase